VRFEGLSFHVVLFLSPSPPVVSLKWYVIPSVYLRLCSFSTRIPFLSHPTLFTRLSFLFFIIVQETHSPLRRSDMVPLQIPDDSLFLLPPFPNSFLGQASVFLPRCFANFSSPPFFFLEGFPTNRVSPSARCYFFEE